VFFDFGSAMEYMGFEERGDDDIAGNLYTVYMNDGRLPMLMLMYELVDDRYMMIQ
jgi:hypothetical protein